jgi:hypothetical protein
MARCTACLGWCCLEPGDPLWCPLETADRLTPQVQTCNPDTLQFHYALKSTHTHRVMCVCVYRREHCQHTAVNRGQIQPAAGHTYVIAARHSKTTRAAVVDGVSAARRTASACFIDVTAARPHLLV